MTTLTNAKAFKGILQYKSTDKFTKEAGYVYFIREFNENSEETGNAEIYFGNRKYGDVNVSQLSEIESILERIDELAQEIEGKQNIIDDIDNIREGASLGSTALQSIPTKVSDLTNDSGFITINDINNGVKPYVIDALELANELGNFTEDDSGGFSGNGIISQEQYNKIIKAVENKNLIFSIGDTFWNYATLESPYQGSTILISTRIEPVIPGNGGVFHDLMMFINEETLECSVIFDSGGNISNLLDGNIKTVNGESLVGSGNIVVGNIISEEDDSLSVDDVNTNTYVKYVAQSLTSTQKTQVRENIGLSNTKSKIITTSERSGTISLTANEIVHVASALTGSTTIQITHRTVNHDDEWGIKFFITSTTPPTISFTCSNSTYPISWLNNNMPIFENGYMYEMTFKQFNNQYLAVCGKFPI